MNKLVGTGSIFSYLDTSQGATTIAITFIIIAALTLIAKLTKLNIFGIFQRMLHITLNVSSRIISRSEINYHRDLAIGKIDEKRRRVKTYRFLNDLIIDLGLKQIGATPYEFLFISLAGSFILAVVICQSLFGNIWMSLALFPIAFVGIMSLLYTKANVSHDTRIENVIEAENIICNNISGGVVVSVRSSLNVIPMQVRGEFKDFLDNIEHKNYHIKTALMELNQHLGVAADDFIKKCIVFEMEEEHGIVGMFKDVVEINNIKMEMRTEMKRKFEEVVTDFVIGSTMIFLFLGGVLAVYTDVASFYFKTPIGQIILLIDALLVIGEFVFITYLRAKEL